MMTDILQTPVSRRTAIRLAAGAIAAPAISLGPSCLRALAEAAAMPLPPQAGGTQDIAPANVLEPSQLAALLSQPADKPAIICVGFKFLYDAAHVRGSLYHGPGREGDGIVSLAKWAGNVSNTKPVVLYCGCCPWDKCPNILPAYQALKKMSFSQVKVLRINQNFGADWVDKGFPTDKK